MQVKQAPAHALSVHKATSATPQHRQLVILDITAMQGPHPAQSVQVASPAMVQGIL